jgi:chaperone protein EcpD
MYKNFTAPTVSRFLASLLRRCRLGTALALLGVGGAQADMIIDTTRVIYPEARREVTFKVINAAKDKPAFVQMWLDDGNAAAAPEDAVTPFNLTPPIARLKANASQVVRLTFTGEPLPADRESIFYFNMLELPQKSNDENKISFAVRTRIKVFFRPKMLRGDPVNLMGQVVWKVQKQGANWVAEANNPTPYHMSFFSLSLGQSGSYEPSVDGGMVPPMGKTSVVLGEVAKITKPFNQLKVEYITDYGGSFPIETPVSATP